MSEGKWFCYSTELSENTQESQSVRNNGIYDCYFFKELGKVDI